MFEYALKIDRDHIFDGQTEDLIIERYRHNYGINLVSIEQIRHHAQLEGDLTDLILSSRPEDRAAVSANAYTRLYSELSWLTSTGGDPGGERWRNLLHDNAQVYEIGSGAGHLAGYLNKHGVHCVRTDISAERNAANEVDGARITDGVNLSRYVDQPYDYVISDQVVEHLHPADLIAHFSEARKILKSGGSYIFRAPNAHCGPADLSLVFDLDKAVFMHLHEFTWQDVKLITQHCGYARASAIFTVPGTGIAIPSMLYRGYLTLIERIFAKSPRFRKFSRLLYFPTQVWVKLDA